MSEEELLSQDEIDVLLNGVDEGDVDTDETASEPVVSGGVKAYDLTSQDHIVRGRMPTLEMINERFTRYTELSLFNLFRQTPQVTPAKIENIKLSEYLQMLGIPTSLNMVKIHPLRGTALFVLDADLVVNLVDRFFGGGTHENDIAERDFTIIEKRIIQKILNQVFVDMKEAWKTVMDIDFEYTGAEDNPAMVKVASSSEVVVLSTFDVKIEGKGGKIQVAIPYSMLEPVRETLDSGVQADMEDSDDTWLESLQEDIRYASVPISCRVAERKIKLREILSFKVGDVIPIEMPESSTLLANGVPLFEAGIGASNEHLALKIKRQIKRSGKPS
ncbi:MAG: flagellar motor switch protein FliM [Pseudomonadales bacterium]